MGLEFLDADAIGLKPEFRAPFGGKGFGKPRATFAPADNASRSDTESTFLASHGSTH